MDQRKNRWIGKETTGLGRVWSFTAILVLLILLGNILLDLGRVIVPKLHNLGAWWLQFGRLRLSLQYRKRQQYSARAG